MAVTLPGRVNLRNADNTPVAQLRKTFLLDLSKPGATAQKISATKKRCTPNMEVACSPDSKQFAFLSDVEKQGQLELYIETPGGPARKLTSLTGFLDSPRWSPDGKKIALLFTENAPRAAGPLEPSTRESGVIEEHIYEQRLTLVDPANGKSNQISPADTIFYEFDWAPDSDRLAWTWPLRATATTTGGSPSSTLSPLPPAKFIRFTKRSCSWPIRASRPMEKTSPSSAAS